LKTHDLAVAHSIDMYEWHVQGGAVLCSSPKTSDCHYVPTSVNELLRLSAKVIEILGYGCEHLLCDALCSAERPRRRTSAASLDPFDLLVIQVENRRNIFPIECIVPASNCLHIVL